MNVRDEIDNIKKSLNITRDEDLGDLLGIGQSSVSAWIRRGNIPAKHILVINAMVEKMSKDNTKPSNNGKSDITNSDVKSKKPFNLNNVRFFKFDNPNTEIWIPKMLTPVSNGNPSWRGDDTATFINAAKHLHGGSFFVEAKGESMIGAGIVEGMLLLVDTLADPINNRVVLASVNGVLTVKRLKTNGQRWLLHPDPKRADIPEILIDDDDIEVIGVVIKAELML